MHNVRCYKRMCLVLRTESEGLPFRMHVLTEQLLALRANVYTRHATTRICLFVTFKDALHLFKPIVNKRGLSTWLVNNCQQLSTHVEKKNMAT